MHRARTGYRNGQDARLRELEEKLPLLEKGVADLKRRVADLTKALAEAKAETEKWKSAYESLKKRALASYYSQREEIDRLRAWLGDE